MVWYSVDMPEASVTDGVYHRFCREFQKAFIGADAPQTLALFACRKSRAEKRRLYLSPDAGEYVPHLMQNYDAKPCSVPEESSVILVYGAPNAKSLLSPSETVAVPKWRDAPAIYPISNARQAASGG